MSTTSSEAWEPPHNSRFNLISKLISSFQNHIMADIVIGHSECLLPNELYLQLFTDHINVLFSQAEQIYLKAVNILQKNSNSLDLLYNVMIESVAGSKLYKILCSLLLLPTDFVKTKIDNLITLIGPLNQLNQLLPLNWEAYSNNKSGIFYI